MDMLGSLQNLSTIIVKNGKIDSDTHHLFGLKTFVFRWNFGAHQNRFYLFIFDQNPSPISVPITSVHHLLEHLGGLTVPDQPVVQLQVVVCHDFGGPTRFELLAHRVPVHVQCLLHRFRAFVNGLEQLAGQPGLHNLNKKEKCF